MDISKLITSDEQWDAMSDAERLAAVREGRLNKEQLKQGLAEGSAELRAACEDELSRQRTAFEEMLRRATSGPTDALSGTAVQALKDLNRRLARDHYEIVAEAFGGAPTIKSALKRVAEALSAQHASLVDTAAARTSFVAAAMAASDSALEMLASAQARAVAGAFADLTASKHWREGITAAGEEAQAMTAAAVGAHLARMAEMSVLAESALARIDWESFAGRLRVPETLTDLAKDRFLGFAQSHDSLLASFRRSETVLLSLPPNYSALSTQEFFIGSRLAESVSVEEAQEREAGDEGEEAQREIAEETSDALTLLLRRLDPSLVRLRDGAVRALVSDNPDRVRHAVTSYRELFTHVLHRLSPGEEFRVWSTSPDDYDRGRPTRKARLRFICRHINHGAYTAFVEKDVAAMLAMVDLFQHGTHGVEPGFSEVQLTVFHVRVEAMIRLLLEIYQGGDGA